MHFQSFRKTVARSVSVPSWSGFHQSGDGTPSTVFITRRIYKERRQFVMNSVSTRSICWRAWTILPNKCILPSMASTHYASIWKWSDIGQCFIISLPLMSGLKTSRSRLSCALSQSLQCARKRWYDYLSFTPLTSTVMFPNAHFSA